jgi:hydroxypyruvate reductase
MDGLTLQDLRAVTKALLASGAPIHEINTVRKHLTDFSGGKVAALSTAPVAALIISDVVGNNPSHIASGPCAPDESTFSDAASILARYAIDPPNVVKVHLERGMRGDIAENPKPGDPLFNKVINRIVNNAGDALSRVEAHLEQAGISVINLGEVEGDTKTIAEQHAALVREKLLRTRRPFALLSGGETTVALRNMPGRGGRNTEYLLALGLALEGIEEVWAIACDTDGIDGTENNAGAIWTPDTLSRARTLNIDATSQLDRNDAYGFFSALDDLVVTGPTRTNVNDFRLVILN